MLSQSHLRILHAEDHFRVHGYLDEEYGRLVSQREFSAAVQLEISQRSPGYNEFSRQGKGGNAEWVALTDEQRKGYVTQHDARVKE